MDDAQPPEIHEIRFFYYLLFYLLVVQLNEARFWCRFFFIHILYMLRMCSLTRAQHSSLFFFITSQNIIKVLCMYSKPYSNTAFFLFLQRASRWNIIKRQRHNGWFTDYFASKCGNRPLGKNQHFIYDYCSLFVSYSVSTTNEKQKKKKNSGTKK